MTDFSGTFDTGLGIWTFYIYRPDGANVFVDPVTGNPCNDYQVKDISGNQNWNQDLDAGGYNIVISLITNQVFDLTVTAPDTIAPDPAHAAGPNQKNYILNVQ